MNRCPSCGATVRAGDPWCTLCWTDLRPAPPPAPVAAVPPPATLPAAPAAPVPAAAAPAAPAFAAVATVDPLTAPLDALLAAPAPEPRGTWPCVECGAANGLDLDACGTCAAPFGGRIARVDVAETRRKMWLISIGAVVTFLVLLAGVTLAMSSRPPDPAPVPIESTE